MRRRRRALLIAVTALAAAVAWFVLPAAAFHLLPPGMTGEAERLAVLLDVSPGGAVAEIGAGGGAMTVEMARRVGTTGKVYANELAADRRRDIQARVNRAELGNVVVVEGLATNANLLEACCDAIFMRNVYHHVTDPSAFNLTLREAMRPGGPLAIIDFQPGAFWHLGRVPEGAAQQRTGHGVGSLAVARELEFAGFELEQIVDDWGGRMFLVLLRAPVGDSD